MEIVMGAEAAESPPNMSSATILYCHVVEPFRTPCTLVMKGVAATTVVLLPMVQGLQLAWVTLMVNEKAFALPVLVVNVPLKAVSVEPAMTTL